MYKRYLVNGKEERLFYNDFANIITWWHPTKHVNVDYKVCKDKEGKEFFVMKGNTIYLDDNLTYTLEECKVLAGKGELSQDDFVNAILKVGVENIRLIVPCRKIIGYFAGILPDYSDEKYNIECYIDEKTQTHREVKNNYKIVTQAVDSKNYNGYHDWYISDLVSYINKGIVKIK